jgi:hypothetical protein
VNCWILSSIHSLMYFLKNSRSFIIYLICHHSCSNTHRTSSFLFNFEFWSLLINSSTDIIAKLIDFHHVVNRVLLYFDILYKNQCWMWMNEMLNVLEDFVLLWREIDSNSELLNLSNYRLLVTSVRNIC